jgi:hypothetical protein
MKSWLTIFCFCLASVAGFAQQDLTGIWRGHFRSGGRSVELNLIDDRYRFEVQIEQVNKGVKGVTYSYHSTDFYAKAAAKGFANPATGKLVLQELRIIEVRKASNTFVCAMTCFLTYTRSGNEEFLEGSYTAMNVNDSSFCGKGSVFLRRVVQSDFYKEPFIVKREQADLAKKQALAAQKPKSDNSASLNSTQKTNPSKPNTTASGKTNAPNTNTPSTASTNKPNSKTTGANANTQSSTGTAVAPPKSTPTPPLTSNGNVPDPKPGAMPSVEPVQKPINVRKPAAQNIPSVLSSRSNELVKTFTFSSREVSIQLYDNGTIDKDTVSVYLDNKLIISKRMLTTQPISFSFEMDDNNDQHELVMVAENLGEIPPNTSLMVVKAGTQQFEVRITSTEQKNAMVIFRYQKKE